MITLTELVIAALATWQAVELWRHSELLATWRARTELWEGFFGRLLACPFCLSVWVGGIAALIVALPEIGAPHSGWWDALCAVGLGILGTPILLIWFWTLQLLVSTWRNPVFDWVDIGILAITGSIGVGAVTWIGYLMGSVLTTGYPVLLWTGLWAAKLLVLGFAVARLANLGNDLTHHRCRTPNRSSKSGFGIGNDFDFRKEQQMIREEAEYLAEMQAKFEKEMPPCAVGDNRDDTNSPEEPLHGGR